MSEDIIFLHNLICIFLHMNLNEHFFYWMAGVAQLVERWIVIPVVEGSNPFARPRKSWPNSAGNINFFHTFPPAGVAQLDRASDFGSEGWGFESFRPRQYLSILAALFTIIHTSFVPLRNKILQNNSNLLSTNLYLII